MKVSLKSWSQQWCIQFWNFCDSSDLDSRDPKHQVGPTHIIFFFKFYGPVADFSNYALWHNESIAPPESLRLCPRRPQTGALPPSLYKAGTSLGVLPGANSFHHSRFLEDFCKRHPLCAAALCSFERSKLDLVRKNWLSFILEAGNILGTGSGCALVVRKLILS